LLVDIEKTGNDKTKNKYQLNQFNYLCG